MTLSVLEMPLLNVFKAGLVHLLLLLIECFSPFISSALRVLVIIIFFPKVSLGILLISVAQKIIKIIKG